MGVVKLNIEGEEELGDRNEPLSLLHNDLLTDIDYHTYLKSIDEGI